ncbi:phosphoribosylglycinamide formyltransferase [Ahrensia sp. R2A130]|uniref:phosphoribosylglycinamide formyltransferase n=1 Tax=Ahrensia sp. R2A130 TaxID=744979 RepID=UPI0001E0941C|nr:phosphoribosylglycinamide formyltransferase [Ahrensia sp. R2A130]EFL90573.1 phosphoribosylglycinamide formyltransferase [Ahrensia sp. R2A130]
MSKLKVAVLISGRGSNMGSLARACMDPDFPAEIVLVLSNRPNVLGLELAREHDLPIRVVDHTAYPDREAHEEAICAAMTEAGAELVCMAGYMRIVGQTLLGKWRGKVVNIHPSLLPSFRGVDTHERAIDAGVRVHGCTVHYVSPELDAGPIIAQAVVPLHPNDDAETLSTRVLDMEHKLYPHAVRLIAEKMVRWSGDEAVEDRKVTIDDVLMLPEIKTAEDQA